MLLQILLLLLFSISCNPAGKLHLSFPVKPSVEQPLVISDITNIQAIENEAAEVTFSISNAQTNLCLTTFITLTSSNPIVVPATSFTLTGSNEACIATITPSLNQQGLTSLSVVIAETRKTFDFNVGAPSPLLIAESAFGTNSVLAINKAYWSWTDLSVIAPDGNLLLFSGTENQPGPKYAEAILTKLDSVTGASVNSFNTTGEKKIDFGGAYDYPADLMYEDDGKLTGLAISENIFGHYRINMFRTLANGTLDPSFGTSGYSDIDVCGIYCFANKFLKLNGKYYVAANDAGYEDVVLFRLNEDGSRDTSMVISRFDPTPFYQLILSTGLVTDGTHLYALYVTDWQRQPGIENYILCKFDLDGVRVPAFGTAGCLTIMGNNTAAYKSGRLVLDPTSNSLYIGLMSNNLPGVAKVSTLTGALDANFGSAGVLALNEVKLLVDLKIHQEYGLMILSEYLAGARKTYAIDLYKKTDGARWPQNKLANRYIGMLDPLIDFLPQSWAMTANSIYVTGLVLNAPVPMSTQKLTINH